MVYEVTNRGRGAIDLTGKTDEQSSLNVADLMRRGAIVVNSAWQGELRGSAPLIANFPVATDGKKAIVRPMRLELGFDASATRGLEGAKTPVPLPYPTSTVDKSQSRLYVRQNEADAWKELPAQHFDFPDRNQVKINPADGYDHGAIYDLVYPATEPVVAGVSFASVRDLISFLKRGENGNPLTVQGRPVVKKAMAVGLSQSGRFLRVMLWQGFNADAQGHVVFDGLMPVIAGGRKGDFNRLFAIPGASSTQHFGTRYPDNGFPFAYTTTVRRVHRQAGTAC